MEVQKRRAKLHFRPAVLLGTLPEEQNPKSQGERGTRQVPRIGWCTAGFVTRAGARPLPHQSRDGGAGGESRGGAGAAGGRVCGVVVFSYAVLPFVYSSPCRPVLLCFFFFERGFALLRFVCFDDALSFLSSLLTHLVASGTPLSFSHATTSSALPRRREANRKMVANRW